MDSDDVAEQLQQVRENLRADESMTRPPAPWR